MAVGRLPVGPLDLGSDCGCGQLQRADQLLWPGEAVATGVGACGERDGGRAHLGDREIAGDG